MELAVRGLPDETADDAADDGPPMPSSVVIQNPSPTAPG